LLQAETNFSPADIQLGHRRVFLSSTLTELIRESDLNPVALLGNFLKPFSNQQMEQLPEALLQAYQALGHKHWQMAAEIYMRCERKEG
jgi:hypothetical protein